MANIQSGIKHVQGFKVAGVAAGIKKANQLDMALVVSDRPCACAGVFTRNLVKAAPVLLGQESLKMQADKVRALVVNSGCANACTGSTGYANAEQMCAWVAEGIDVLASQVLCMSTGVIGAQLPMNAVKNGVELALQALAQDWGTTAKAIMTTDHYEKMASVEVLTPNGAYTIAGMSKGAGMIAPNMATMLGIIVTDAKLSVAQVQQALGFATDQSFNRIVVDGDMSTNDTVYLMANGASGLAIESDAEFVQFVRALSSVCKKLAQDIVRDGEGATKFITIQVTGAKSDEDAWKVGQTIATSMLVKTAFFGNDANWGRIIAAAGRAGVAFDPDQAKLWFMAGENVQAEGALLLFEGGMPSSYLEDDAFKIISEAAVIVRLDCGLGTGEAIIWTSDLSHDYVSINAEYRT
ncbi:bifunctional glutamate N-acetyltransferase/amino-acid acetyltransferase ArgJ [Anaerolineales bacterium]